MKGDSNRQGRRFALRGWHLILAGVIVLAGSIGIYLVARRISVNRRLAALHAAGHPTSFTELAEYNKLPEGAKNAADLYVQAFAAFVPPVDETNVPLIGSAQLPPRSSRLPQPMVKAISECVAANRKCLLLLQEAVDIEDCRYDWNYASDMPHAKGIRCCIELLELAALSDAQEGNTDAVVAHLREMSRLADSLHREPGTFCHLARIGCHAVCLVSLERALNVTALTEVQLTGLDAMLAETVQTMDLVEAMITERCLMIEGCRDPSYRRTSGRYAAILKGLGGGGLADTLDYMGAYIEASRLPHTQRIAAFRAVEAEMEQLSWRPRMTAELVLPATTRVAELDLRLQAHLRLARTALAVERCRLTMGKVAEQLNELVPRYLEQVPIDPFDGKPIRYRRREPGYRLYSVAEDGQDNGGQERDPNNRDKPSDLCFGVAR